MTEFNPRQELNDFLKPYKGKELTINFLQAYHLKLTYLFEISQILDLYSQTFIAVKILELDSYMIINLKEGSNLKMIKMMLDSYRYDFLASFNLNNS